MLLDFWTPGLLGGRGALSGNPRTTAGRGGSALRWKRIGFSLGQQSLEIDHMAASSPREQIHVRLNLDPAARAELERIADQDRRSVASAASLLLEASLRARQRDINEGAVQHG
jgi:hypothetical protein